MSDIMSFFLVLNRFAQSRLSQCLGGAALLMLSLSAQANNGLNAIGYSTESLAMGGADLALAQDPSALNSNPAGLSQLGTKRLDFQLAGAYALGVSHRDNLGNDLPTGNQYILLGTSSYAQPASEKLTWGIGMFAQGGAGYEYFGLRTAFGSTDSLESHLGLLKLSAGGAYAVDSKLSLGASLGLVYGSLDQRIFPNTSDLASSFFGFGVNNAHGAGLGFKVGLQFHPNQQETWGLAYTSPTNLTLYSNDLLSNQTALGFGMVRYTDVKMSGIGLPQEIGIAYARQATPKFLWTAELNWLNWSAAMKTSTLTASQPDNPGSPDFSITSVNNWRDQYVLAIGTAYSLSDHVIWRAGYNYGRNPIPDKTLNPLLASIAEHHLTTGLGIELDKHWLTNISLQYNVLKTVNYKNTTLPLGTDAQERNEVLALYWSISRLW